MRVALHTVLKPEHADDYEAAHREVPSAVAQALRAHGVRDWQIWRDGCDVFHVIDVDRIEDYHAMREALRDDPDNLAWQARVAPFFEVADDYAGNDPVIASLWSLSGQGGHAGQALGESARDAVGQ